MCIPRRGGPHHRRTAPSPRLALKMGPGDAKTLAYLCPVLAYHSGLPAVGPSTDPRAAAASKEAARQARCRNDPNHGGPRREPFDRDIVVKVLARDVFATVLQW